LIVQTSTSEIGIKYADKFGDVGIECDTS